MPSVTYLYTWTGDAESWITNSGIVHWIGTDGSALDTSADPGCMEINVLASAFGIDPSFSQGSSGPSGTWEDFGVPAGQTVTGVKARLRYKDNGETNIHDATFTVSVYRADTGDGIADVLNQSVAGASSSWQTLSGGSESNIYAGFGASTYRVGFAVELHGHPLAGTSYEYHARFDSLELTIYYGESVTPITISPAAATLHPGETQHFTTDIPANWTIPENPSGTGPGGTDGTAGKLTNIASDGKSADYTAPPTYGTYHVRVTDQTSPTNTTQATVSNDHAPGVAIAMPDTTGFQGFLFTSTGARKSLPSRFFRAARWSDERYGGWTEFSLDLNLPVKEAATYVAQGDLVEFWFEGVRRYRGIVFSVATHKEDPDSATVSGHGISYLAGKRTVKRAFVYPGLTDISRTFADMMADVVSRDMPNLSIEAHPVGAMTQYVDATYKLAGEVLNSLVSEQGENLALWGGDVDDTGRDRLYIKPFSPGVDYSIPVPGPNVTAAGSETEGAEIVNRLTIQGGTPRYPNLIYNASFERPLFYGELEGQLLENGSFETGDGWSGAGDHIPSSTTYGNAYNGAMMYFTDHVGAYNERTQNPTTVAIVPGNDYTIAIWARLEAVPSDSAGRVVLTWLDSGGGSLGTVTLDVPAYGSTTGQALNQFWQQYAVTARAPAAATGFTYRVEHAAGGDSSHAILWDVAEVSQASDVYQDRWTLELNGSAAVNRLNWAYPDAVDGGYSVLLDVTSSSDDNNDAVLQPVGKQRFEVQPAALYRAFVCLKSAPGETTNPPCELQVWEYDSTGANTFVTQIPIAGGAGWPTWTQFSSEIGLRVDTTHVCVCLAIKGTGAILVDAFSFRDASAIEAYIRDGNYTLTLVSDDPGLSGVSEAAVNSIATYGYRDGIVQAEGVTNYDDAYAYAAAYFNVHAAPWPHPTVTIVNDKRNFRTGQQIRLIGPDGAALMGGEDSLPIVRIDWTWDGNLVAQIALQKELPDLVDLLLQKLKRLGGGGGGGGYTSTSAGSPGSTGTHTPLTVSEADGSPSIANVTAIQVTNGRLTDMGGGLAALDFIDPEVIEARFSDIFGPFVSLDARLDYIEWALTNGTIVPPGFTPSLDFSVPYNSQYLPVI